MKLDFGFNFLPPAEKTKEVQDIFRRVASRYDLMNDLMSCGLHRFWKDIFINEIPASIFDSSAGIPLLLDMATGTGDIAQRLLKRLMCSGYDCKFLLCDLNVAMLQEGKKRLTQDNFSWICANAENLPFLDNLVSLYTIAFGLRNVTHKEKALAEAFRILSPGGFFYCLEFSHTTSPLLQGLYDLYSFGWIPLLGKAIANDRKAYQYLVESIRMFPSAPLLETLIQEAGFQNTGFRTLSKGLVAIHWGQKLADKKELLSPF